MKVGIERTLEWFEKAVPTPNAKSVAVQLGVHFEEVAEMLVALGLPHLELLAVSQDLKQGNYTEFLEHSLKNESVRIDVLDAIGDQIVTGVGSAHMIGLDVVKALDEINRSNFTKFDKDENPLKDENGKIMKGEFYEAPDLTPFI
jgi:hypothetical protein